MAKSTQLLIQVASIIAQKSPALVLITNLVNTPGTGQNEKRKKKWAKTRSARKKK